MLKILIFLFLNFYPKMGIEIFDKGSSIEPLVYINNSPYEIVVMIDLPCVDKKDIDLKVSEKAVEIEAVIKDIHTRNYGKNAVKFMFFHKIIELPARIVQEKVRAKFEKNVLLITMPKDRNVKTIKIE